jgi:type VI secretion system secreted protein Hcp
MRSVETCVRELEPLTSKAPRSLLYKDEVELLSYSWGVTNAAHIGPGGGGAAAEPPSSISTVHKIDKTSPNLLKACATGEHLKGATLTFRKAGKGQQDFLINQDE